MSSLEGGKYDLVGDGARRRSKTNEEGVLESSLFLPQIPKQQPYIH